MVISPSKIRTRVAASGLSAIKVWVEIEQFLLWLACAVAHNGGHTNSNTIAARAIYKTITPALENRF